MLEAAIVLQLAIGERMEACIIAVLLIFNVALGVFQEGRASVALAALKSKLALNAFANATASGWRCRPPRSYRATQYGSRSGALFPRTCAFSMGSVLLDQSMLTGESVAVEIGAGKTAYASALVRRGLATAEVTATGRHTYFGKTAELVRIAHAQSGEQAASSASCEIWPIFNGAIVVLLVAYAHSIAMPVDHIIPLVLTALLASIPVALPATFTLGCGIECSGADEERGAADAALGDPRGGDGRCAVSDKTGTLTRNELTVATVRCMQSDLSGGGCSRSRPRWQARRRARTPSKPPFARARRRKSPDLEAQGIALHAVRSRNQNLGGTDCR